MEVVKLGSLRGVLVASIECRNAANCELDEMKGRSVPVSLRDPFRLHTVKMEPWLAWEALKVEIYVMMSTHNSWN